MIPLMLRRDGGIEALTLQRRHRRLTEVTRVQRRRDQRLRASLLHGGGDPGLIQLRTRRLRHRCGLLLVVALVRHATCQDDLAGTIDARLRVTAILPPVVGRLHDRQLGVRGVGLGLVRRGLHDRTGFPPPALRPGALPLSLVFGATLPFGFGHGLRFRLQPPRSSPSDPPAGAVPRATRPHAARPTPPRRRHRRPGPASAARRSRPAAGPLPGSCSHSSSPCAAKRCPASWSHRWRSCPSGPAPPPAPGGGPARTRRRRRRGGSGGIG